MIGETEIPTLHDLTLSCESNGNPPITSYKWLRNGVIFGTSQLLNLYFTKINSWHYSCEVSNGFHTKTSDSVTVTVLRKFIIPDCFLFSELF